MGTFGGKQQTLHLHQLIQIIKSDNVKWDIFNYISDKENWCQIPWENRFSSSDSTSPCLPMRVQIFPDIEKIQKNIPLFVQILSYPA